MHVTNLDLRDFRNYHTLHLALSPGVTLLYGPNASGKTSLLESLFYLATTRSPRAGSDRELVRWGAQGEIGAPPFARIAASVQQASGSSNLEILLQLHNQEASAPPPDDPARPPQPHDQASTHKTIRLNRKSVRSLDLVGQLRVVLFTPADLNLVDGPPSARRRYLDITLSQLDPRYVRTLSAYNKLVQQRNSLLRAWRDRQRPMRGIENELEYWDQELSNAGGYVLAQRLHAVTELSQIASVLFRTITSNDYPLEVLYQSSCALEGASSPSDLAAQLAATLRSQRRHELARGQTLSGPHRDDLLFTVGSINLGTYGSRGQQRSVALALKLAEARLMQQRSGEAPVVLLDDLLSELDMRRRGDLLRTIDQPDQQALLTATDLGDFDADFLQQATRLRVEAGQIFPT